jgi:type IV secretory pathway VirD2 relaxase
MTRVVRHQGKRFRSAPLTKYMAYLKREGVTRDGSNARMFDATSDDADVKTFGERCEDDRHHFRFIVSPEYAAELESLRTFARDLMADAERDLGTKLDWVGVDHCKRRCQATLLSGASWVARVHGRRSSIWLLRWPLTIFVRASAR